MTAQSSTPGPVERLTGELGLCGGPPRESQAHHVDDPQADRPADVVGRYFRPNTPNML